MRLIPRQLFGLGLGLGLAWASGCVTAGGQDCPPGGEACPCYQGNQCAAGLACVSGFCVDPSAADETGDDEDPTGDDMDEEGDGDGDPTGGETCNDPEPQPPAPFAAQACLPNVPCVSDANCPAGHACNTELDPPACQLLYCGTEGSICHTDALCDEEMQCHNGQCNPCDICGDLCEVDFESDPEHCGCCDNPVANGGVCYDGVPHCPPTQSLCGDTCVKLDSDPNNCGACGNQLAPGVTCEDGQPSCPDDGNWPQLYCDDTCVDFLHDNDNCGECGATCPVGDCSYPGIVGNTHTYCYIEIDPNPNTTCTIACAEAGMACDSQSYQEVYYEGWCDGIEYVLDCAETVPPSVYCGDAYCECTIASRACRCRPVDP